MSLVSRVKTLERQKRAASKPPLRVVVSGVVGPCDLATATCRRTLCPDGTLLELVTLNSSTNGLSDEELERFVTSFPIEE